MTARFVVLLCLAFATFARAAEPRIFIFGVWPDRMRYFDEKTESFVGDFRVRYGAVWHQDAVLLPDYSRLFVISDQLETVEIIDTARLEVVDEFGLSTPSRKERMLRIAVTPSGSRAFLSTAAVELGTDRILPERPRIVAYDLETREELTRIKPPRGSERARMAVSPDGGSLFLFGADIYEISTETYEVVDKIVLSEERPDGYGSVALTSLQEVEPGVYFGGFRTTDPLHGKEMFGVARLDLETGGLETFEVGPDVNGYLFAVSPDETRAYVGLADLTVIDMEKKLIVKHTEEFERGRENSSLIVSWDGTKLYVSGVGHEIHVYDASDASHIRSIDAGGDVMLPPRVMPRSVIAEYLSGR